LSDETISNLTKSSMKRQIAFALLTLFFSEVTIAQQKSERILTLENIYHENILQTAGIPTIHWLPDESGYVVLEKNNDAIGQDLVHYEPLSGSREVIVGSEQLIPEGETDPLRVSGFTWSEDNKKLLIFTNTVRVWRLHTRGDYWVLDINSGKLKQLGKGLDHSSLMFAKFSPDGSRVAYVSNHNIYVEDLSSYTIRQITFDGGDRYINGTFDWVYEEDWGIRDGFRWSHDGKYIAYWHSDTDGTGTFYMINNIDSIYPTLIPLPYPKAGTANSAVRVGVVSSAGGDTRWFDIPGDSRDNYLIRMDFIPGSNELMIQQMNRLQNRNRVWFGNAETLEIKLILNETDEAWVDVHDNIAWLEDASAFTWTSERDGWRHLYLVSSDGKRIQPITKGEFDVISIQRIDISGGYVYFIASPDNFTQRYLFRNRLDGRGKPEKISPAIMEGQHSYQISPDASFAIHTFENTTTPPVTSLVSLPDHRQIQVFEDNSTVREVFESFGFSPKEFLKIDLEDVTLDAWMIKPPEFDPGKKYPLIFYIYGEPAGATVQDNWGGGDLWHHYLARQGYLVISIDNRGTRTPRGRDWRKSIYGQIGILAAHDQANSAKRLFDMFPYIDSDRVGMWGWSGGGQMTLNCMFRYPDIYKAGIALAFVSHQKLYNTVYQERYMGLPDGNPEGYKYGSPITHASGLEGELFLIHGTADDNVHYQSTEMLVDELIRHGKMFDMLSYPMRGHGIRERENTTYHLRKSMSRFWKNKLPSGPE
jgi:dipeptidyl-peptidase 4